MSWTSRTFERPIFDKRCVEQAVPMLNPRFELSCLVFGALTLLLVRRFPVLHRQVDRWGLRGSRAFATHTTCLPEHLRLCFRGQKSLPSADWAFLNGKSLLYPYARLKMRPWKTTNAPDTRVVPKSYTRRAGPVATRTALRARRPC